jgi:hypothetical protein
MTELQPICLILPPVTDAKIPELANHQAASPSEISHAPDAIVSAVSGVQNPLRDILLKYPGTKVWLTESVVEASNEPEPARIKTLAEHTENDLLHEVFLGYCWGIAKSSNDYKARRAEEELQDRSNFGNPIQQRIIAKQREGSASFALAERLKALLRSRKITLGNAIEEVNESSGLSNTTKSIIKKNLKKEAERVEKKSQQSTFLIRPIQLKNGRHPNALASLEPDNQWTILIDESGNFSDDLAPGHRNKDHFVAVCVPGTVTLTELKIHAADENAKNEHAIDQLLQQPVGIFGYKRGIAAVSDVYWVSMLQQLITWVILQLPFNEDQPLSIKVEFEHRQRHAGNQPALEELTLNELKQAHPTRFKTLMLNIDGVSKDHPTIAYADQVSHLWFSNYRKKNLERSLLRDHCLLPADDRSLSQLYLLLTINQAPAPAQWLQLVTAQPNDERGLISDALTRLAEQISRKASRAFDWEDYLAYVDEMLSQKLIQSDTLARAIKWLQIAQPTQSMLPPVLQLHLASSQLASSNHHGHVDMPTVSELLRLTRQLQDEFPHECCHALIRTAIHASNAFEFSVMNDELLRWTNMPIAASGLQNYIKLCSTLGQLAAYRGDNTEAHRWLNLAISNLPSLSDAKTIERMYAQTALYAALLDDSGNALADFTQRALPDVTAPNDLVAKLNTVEHRWLHHAWLRLACRYPQQHHAFINAYLSSESEWLSESSHPGMLINFYRGWLLLDTKPEQARAYFREAISHCEDDPAAITLAWMASVLRTLCESLLPGSVHDLVQPYNNWREALPNAPIDVLEAVLQIPPSNDAARHLLLSQCLPFNWH